jgi:DNA anti-recombination protein RmuC
MNLDKAKTKHQKLVANHMRLATRAKKLMDAQMRVQAKLSKSEKAISRSQKKLDKLVAGKTHNNGPTASVVPEVVEKLML